MGKRSPSLNVANLRAYAECYRNRRQRHVLNRSQAVIPQAQNEPTRLNSQSYRFRSQLQIPYGMARRWRG
jgi:hypothetical protein